MTSEQRRREWILAGALLAAVSACSSPGYAQQSTANPPAQSAPAQPRAAAPAKPVSAKDRRDAERAYFAGARALEQHDPRLAIAKFDQALALDPENTRYLAARELARQHIITLLVQEAEQAKIAGNLDLERDKLEEARSMDPNNPVVLQHTNDLNAMITHGYHESDDGIQVAPPVELTPTPGKRDFHLRTNTIELIRRVLNSYGLTVIVDESVRRDNMRMDVQGLDYSEAADLLKLMTNTFIVPLDPKRVLVAKDTRDNRQKFERLAMETIYMPGLSPTEVTDMSTIAKTVFEIPVEIVQGERATMRLRGPAERLKSLNATFSDLLEGRSEVALDIKLIAIDQTRSTAIGVQLPQQTTVFSVSSELDKIIQQNQGLVNQIISSGLANAGDTTAIVAILLASGAVSGSILNQPFALFGGGLTATGLSLGSVSGSFSLNSAQSRTLDDVSLRVIDQAAATFRSGTRYPIITSTYNSGIGTGGVNIPGLNQAGISSTLASLGLSASSLLTSQQNIPQVQYEDLGLTLKVTPHIQQAKSVALNLDLQVESLGGSFLNNVPVLDHQSYTGFITLKDGESAVVVSYLDRSQTHAVSGLPGMIELPGLHNTTSSNRQETDSSLVILVTPHIIRLNTLNPNGRLVVLPYHD